MVAGFKYGPALKIPVALPDPAQAVGIIAALVTRQDPHLQRIGHRCHDRRQDSGTLRDLLLRARAAPKRYRHGAGQQQQSDDGRVSQPKSRPAHRRRDGHFERDRNRRGRHRRYGLHNRRRQHFLGHFALSHQRFRAQARQRSARRQKPRRVLARWNVDADGMVRPVGLVVFAQPLTQTMRLHADNRIALLVEIGRTPQSLHRDVVFLDLFGGAFKIFSAHVGQHLRQVRGAAEYAGCQNAIQLMSFLPKVGCRLHGKRPRLVEGSIHVRGSDVQVR